MTFSLPPSSSSSSSSSSMRVTFGHALEPSQVLSLYYPKQHQQDDDQDTTDTQIVAFCQAYNEIVVDNYSKVRLVAVLSVLGPLAGLALLYKGVQEQQQQTAIMNEPGLFPSTALLMGPVVLLISTLTAIASVLFLREQLVEQLQDLCHTDYEDLMVTLQHDKTKGTYHLVWHGTEPTTTATAQDIFTAIPLVLNDNEEHVPLVQIV